MNKELFNLTYPQKNIWLVEKYNNNTAINSIVGTVEIKDVFDENICKNAINYVIKNNDAMRMKIIEEDTTVKQCVSDFIEYNPLIVDLTSNSEEDISNYKNSLAKKVIDIKNNNLFEFCILKYSDNCGAIFMKIHHLISDAWSCSKIGTSLIEYIDSKINNIDFEENVKPSYIEYINSENEYKNSEKFKKDEEFWRNYLEDIKEPINIKKSSDNISKNANRYSVRLEKTENDSINSYCKENKISPYVLFMTALSTYLYRIKDNNDYIIGTPVLNRSNFKEKNMVGMFVSTLPLRIKIKENIKFIELAKQIATNTLTLFRHQKYPYAKTLEYIHKTTDIKSNLYNIVLSYQNARTDVINNNIYSTSWVFNEILDDELQIHIVDMDNTGTLNINYDYLVDLFTKEEIKYLHTRIMAIIKNAIDNIEIDVEEIAIMNDEEKNKILYDFNNTDVDYPKDMTIIDLFEEQVKTNPDSIALQFENKKMTYKELNEKANKLGYYLANDKKIINEGIIVSLNNKFELIISIIGILKSGNYYIPVDPKYPIERINMIISESKCKYGFFETNEVKNIIDILNIEDIIMDDKKSYNINNSKVSNVVYNIYTSGSTGKPKGVEISHLSLMNYIFWANKMYVKNNKSDMPLYSSISFDLTVTSIFLPLISGGKIKIYDANDKFVILKIFEDDDVDIVKLTPSHLNIVNQVQGKVEKINTLILGGEVLKTKDCFDMKSLNDVHIYNEYGPTEATVGCMIYEYNIDETSNTVDIGKPSYNNKIYIMDKKERLLPLCVEGEINIYGISVANGYTNVKNSSFVCRENGINMYKTRDIGFIDFNLNAKYISREDTQVKINGNRIELEEIENILKTKLKISNCVAELRYLNKIPSIIVFYISDKELNTSKVNNKLKKYLPIYMLPKKYFKLDEIPLTINGKVDKTKLPEIVINRKKVSKINDYSEDEKKVCEVWKEILQIKEIAREDSIFDYGVDSLSIIKCQIKLSKYYDNIDIQLFYDYPTIYEFCKQLNRKKIDINKVINNEVKYEKVVGYKINISNKKNGNIIFTGATGFLGIHLLKILIEVENIDKVYCIVRGKEYKERIYKLYKYYFPNDNMCNYNKKVIVINGDIGLKNFGLEEEELNTIFHDVTRIINTAAMVKHYGEYEQFERMNYISVKNMIEICKKRDWVLEHISTISIFANKNKYEYDETDFFVGQNYSINPYIKTKFLAEKEIIEEFKKQNLKANIYRIGNITWRYEDGGYQINANKNAFFLRIKTINELGVFPDKFNNIELEFSPVDVIADYILTIILNEKKSGNIYHLFNNKTVNFMKFIDTLNKQNKCISDTEFIEKLRNFNSEENILLNDILSDFSLVNNISNHETNKLLKKYNKEWPQINEKYIKYLYDILKRGDDIEKNS